MGGYALYVWTSYAVTLIVLLGNVVFSGRQLREAKKQAVRKASQVRRRKSDDGTSAS